MSKICFVIMPFGGYFDDYYKDIYKISIEESGLIPKRADDLYKSIPIINDIWNYVISSELIIADLSERNPNVMYELGLAHALAKPVILISDSLETVPFDLRTMRILLYDKNKSNWSNDLKKSLKQYIYETMEAPLESVLPTFIKTKASGHERITEFEKDIIEIKQLIRGISQNLIETDEINAKRPISKLSSEEYSNAIKEAHRLYFDDGLDMADIRYYLTQKYRIDLFYASRMLDSAIRQYHH
ncbi:MAG: hypothetical protein ABIQ93_14480 [Saprospiraceae bacterium]